MAQNIIPFPVRNSSVPRRSLESVARDLHTHDPRDTQAQACRIAQQVEREIARQAARMATGARESRVTRNVLQMPSHPTVVMPEQVGAIGRIGSSMWLLAARIFRT